MTEFINTKVGVANNAATSQCHHQASIAPKNAPIVTGKVKGKNIAAVTAKTANAIPRRNAMPRNPAYNWISPKNMKSMKPKTLIGSSPSRAKKRWGPSLKSATEVAASH